MPILINSETGYAENVPDQAAALSSGKYSIPLVAPDGSEVGVPEAEASSLLAQGYKQPNSEQATNYLKAAHYGSTEQTVKHGLEAVGRGAAGPLFTGAQVALGVDPQDISGRREYGSEATEAIGQGVGLVGGAMTGMGIAGVAEQVATKAVTSLLAPATTALGRIGTSAAKFAVDNALIASGDELSKMIAQDPTQTAETAMANVGMATALGSAFGGGGKAVNELWNATAGKQLTSFLENMKVLTDQDTATAAKELGVDLSPTTIGATKRPQTAKSLSASDNYIAREYTAAVENDIQQIADKTLESIGRTRDDVASLANVSKYQEGASLKQKIVDSVKKDYEPISKSYESLEAPFKKAQVFPVDREAISNQITDFAMAEGYHLRPNSPQMKFIRESMEEMSLVETAEDMLKVSRRLRDDYAFGHENFGAAKKLSRIFMDAKDNVVMREAGKEGPELVNKFKQTQDAYKQIMGRLDDFADQMSVRSPSNVTAFIKNLDNLNEEQLVNKLTAKENVNLQKMLTEQYPDVAKQMQQLELNNVLKKSMKAGEFDTEKFLGNIDKLSPEMRSYIMSADALDNVNSLKELLAKIPTKGNKFNMKGADMPKGASAVINELLMGATNFGTGLISNVMNKIGAGAAPDAARLALLKFIGKDGAASGPGMKAAVAYMEQVVRGEKLINKATAAVFKGGQIGTQIGYSDKDRDKLDKQVTQFTEKPDLFLEHNKDAGYYMESETAAMTAGLARNIQYLAALKPDEAPRMPLDPKVIPSSTAKARYTRALDIANNPLVVLERIQKGTLTTTDIQDFNALYPALGSKLKDKLFNNMVDVISDGKQISYATKLSMSAFMSQPLDSSMTAQAIMANQPAAPNSEPAQGGQPQQKIRVSNKLSKVASESATPQQSRESVRNKQ